jgi:putative tricarboxylic transport membrane protein
MLIQNQPEFFWGVMISMIIGNVLLLVLNLPMIGMWVKILKIPYKVLFPLIILFCLVGAYSVNFRVVDMVVMLVFGGIGYLMKKYQYDGGPLILAFILGPLLETALRQSLIISHGGLDIFVTRPLALGALVIALAFLLFPLIPVIGRKRDELVEAE